VCRFIGYLGPTVTLHELLIAHPYSLLHQSYAPRMQDRGRFNADGFGVAWYDPARQREPARYRNPMPMWTDRSFASIAKVIASQTILGAVRSASPGLSVDESNTHPFVSGAWSFTHNGSVDAFLEGAGVKLRKQVSDDRLAGIHGSTDSELLFALTLDRLDAGASAAGAVADTVARVDDVSGGRLNLLLTEGETFVATAHGPSLFTLRRDGAVIVASEPFDDESDWRQVPDRSLVVATREDVEVTPL
jgi:glutamine amidotransferase